jgi:hypothetical protein
MLSGKVLKFSITSVLCVFPDSVPVSQRSFARLSLLKTESELTFCCRHGLFWSFSLLSLCDGQNVDSSSLVFDRWMTTPMPPLELTDGSVVTGYTAPGFPPCSGTCCTASDTWGSPRTVVVHTVSSGWGTARSMWTFWLTPPTRP